MASSYASIVKNGNLKPIKKQKEIFLSYEKDKVVFVKNYKTYIVFKNEKTINRDILSMIDDYVDLYYVKNKLQRIIYLCNYFRYNDLNNYVLYYDKSLFKGWKLENQKINFLKKNKLSIDFLNSISNSFYSICFREDSTFGEDIYGNMDVQYHYVFTIFFFNRNVKNIIYNANKKSEYDIYDDDLKDIDDIDFSVEFHYISKNKIVNDDNILDFKNCRVTYQAYKVNHLNKTQFLIYEFITKLMIENIIPQFILCM